MLRLRRSPVRVEFGASFLLPEQGKERGRDKDAALNQAADEIMCQIAKLLPAKYWGVYAEHPRLFALLDSTGIRKETSERSLIHD
jgi:hypothetical protein